MARLSATSSAVDTNGHIKEPTTVPLPVEDKAIPNGEPSSPTINTPKASSPTTSASDDEDSSPSSDAYPIPPNDPTILPGGSRDLSFIGLQAFTLGLVLAASISSTGYLLLALHSPWWRLPAFAICFSTFHFLEYYTTARYNAPNCRASSFLLFNNGTAYTFANVFATTEIIVSGFFPKYQAYGVHPVSMILGLVMVVVGQTVRSVAMAQASTNFNHVVQWERKDTHVLVTRGLYSYFRHPSYFGFFWWTIGTQLLVGNKVCLVGFAIVVWRFFARRIPIEEKHLIIFFGDEYVNFKKRTGTKIPFIA